MRYYVFDTRPLFNQLSIYNHNCIFFVNSPVLNVRKSLEFGREVSNI